MKNWRRMYPVQKLHSNKKSLWFFGMVLYGFCPFYHLKQDRLSEGPTGVVLLSLLGFLTKHFQFPPTCLVHPTCDFCPMEKSLHRMIEMIIFLLFDTSYLWFFVWCKNFYLEMLIFLLFGTSYLWFLSDGKIWTKKW